MTTINIVKISSVWNSDRDYSARIYINTVNTRFKRIHLDSFGLYVYFYSNDEVSLIEIQKFKYLCLYKVPDAQSYFK